MSLQQLVWKFTCRVLAWQDGDTLVLEVDHGLRIRSVQTVRLAGINTPEIHTTDVAEKKRGLAALAFVESLAPVGTVVMAQTVKPAEKYGRWLAAIELPDGADLAAVLIAAGHGKTYLGGKR